MLIHADRRNSTFVAIGILRALEPRQAANFLSLLLLGLLCIAVSASARAQEPLDPSQWPVGIVERQDLPESRSYRYDFSQVDMESIAEWLEWFRIELPIDLKGQVSGWIWVQRSSQGWLDFQHYRLESQLNSPLLEISNWQVATAELRLGFSEGVWYVSNLGGVLRSAELDAAKLSLKAKLDSSRDWLVEIDSQASQVVLQAILEGLGVPLDLQNQAGQINLLARSKLNDAGRFDGWKATIGWDLGDVKFYEVPTGLSGSLILENGDWSSRDASLKVVDQSIELNASGSLDDSMSFQWSATGVGLDLSKLLQESKLPYTVDAIWDLNANATGDFVNGLDSLDAALDSRRLTVQDIAADSGHVELHFAPSTGAAGRFELAVLDGNLDGTLSWRELQDIWTDVPRKARVQLEGIDVVALGEWLNLPSLSGRLEGVLEVDADPNQEAHAYQLQGDFALEDLSLFGSEKRMLRLELAKRSQEQQLELRLADGRQSLQADLTAQLTAGQPWQIDRYQCQGSLEGFSFTTPTAPLLKRLSELTGHFSLEGASENWLAVGEADFSSALVEFVGRRVALDRLALQLTPSSLVAREFRIYDVAGRIAGSAAFMRTPEGQHQVNLRWAGLEIEPYAKMLLGDGLVPDGRLKGEVRLVRNAKDGQVWFRGWQGSLAAAVEELIWTQVAIGSLVAEGTLSSDGLVKLNVGGELLDGVADLRSQFPSSIGANVDELWRNATLEGTWRDVSLDKCIALLAGPRAGLQYNGKASLELRTAEPEVGAKRLVANITTSTLQRSGRVLADAVESRIALQMDSLILDEFRAELAGGRAEARGDLQWGEGLSGGLRINANRLKLGEFVSLVSAESAEQVEGMLTCRADVRFGRSIAAEGDLSLQKGQIYSIPIQELRSRFSADLSWQGVLRNLLAHGVHGTLLGGRVDGDFELTAGPQFGFESSFQIRQGALEQLSRALGFEHVVGRGAFDAAGTLASKDFASLRALEGNVGMEFNSGDAQSFPVLPEIDRIIPATKLASGKISSGLLKANLRAGQANVSSLLLNGDIFSVAASGKAGIASGRLDMDAVVETESGVVDPLIQERVTDVAAGLAPQVGLLFAANEFISGRTIFLHLGGTTSHPVVKLQTDKTLAAAFLRRLQRQLLRSTGVRGLSE